MAEFRLGRVKFNWTTECLSKSYLIDDLIKFGGNSYVAIANHTSKEALQTSTLRISQSGVFTSKVFLRKD